MRIKRAVLLFEIMVVVLLVSIASVFLFRGYGAFIKAGRKSLDYLRLILFCEEKMWDLELKERKGEITDDIESKGDFGPEFSWELYLEDTDYDKLKKGTLKLNREKRKTSFEAIEYLLKKE